MYQGLLVLCKFWNAFFVMNEDAVVENLFIVLQVHFVIGMNVKFLNVTVVTTVK